MTTALFLGIPRLDGAACASYDDPDLWHSDDPLAVSWAKRICKTACPRRTRAACLEWAIRNDRPGDRIHGVWGGMTTPERRDLMLGGAA